MGKASDSGACLWGKDGPHTLLVGIQMAITTLEHCVVVSFMAEHTYSHMYIYSVYIYIYQYMCRLLYICS